MQINLRKHQESICIYFYKQLSIENIEELKNFVTDNFHQELLKNWNRIKSRIYTFSKLN
jgi:hypothetical protein